MPVANFLAGQAGVDVNTKDKPSGHTPLHRACIAGQTRDKVRKGAAWLLALGSWLCGVVHVRTAVRIIQTAVSRKTARIVRMCGVLMQERAARVNRNLSGITRR